MFELKLSRAINFGDCEWCAGDIRPSYTVWRYTGTSRVAHKPCGDWLIAAGRARLA